MVFLNFAHAGASYRIEVKETTRDPHTLVYRVFKNGVLSESIEYREGMPAKYEQAFRFNDAEILRRCHGIKDLIIKRMY